MSDIICYFVEGLGCSSNSSNITSEIDWIQQWNYNIPRENIKYKCHKYSSGLKCILSTFFNNLPLAESRFVYSLAQEILSDLKNTKYNKIFVYAHSFGGAIINRVAQIINLNIDEDIDISYLDKLQIATFGSIFIPPKNTISDINILNYISISDVAIKCNHITPFIFDDLPISLIYNDNIVCKLQPPTTISNSIVQICLYKDNIPLCTGRISILKWSEHTSYSLLIGVFLKQQITNAYDFSKIKSFSPYLTYPRGFNFNSSKSSKSSKSSESSNSSKSSKSSNTSKSSKSSKSSNTSNSSKSSKSSNTSNTSKSSKSKLLKLISLKFLKSKISSKTKRRHSY
jgi:hypothetical protein